MGSGMNSPYVYVTFTTHSESFKAEGWRVIKVGAGSNNLIRTEEDVEKLSESLKKLIEEKYGEGMQTTMGSWRRLEDQKDA